MRLLVIKIEESVYEFWRWGWRDITIKMFWVVLSFFFSKWSLSIFVGWMEKENYRMIFKIGIFLLGKYGISEKYGCEICGVEYLVLNKEEVWLVLEVKMRTDYMCCDFKIKWRWL